MGERPQVFLVAGEVSGDIYGADLVDALRAEHPGIHLSGVGGPRMARAGVSLVTDSTEWGVVGWLEVLRALPAFILRLRGVRREIIAARPSAVVLIDFPGFNLPLAQSLRGRFPVAYFMPPMVSTRKGDRAVRIARLGMHLLPAFHFEAEAYRAAGADAAFVGHPAVDRVRAHTAPDEVRRRAGVRAGDLLLSIFPGSRRQELARHLPVMVEALNRVRARFSALAAALPLASPRFRPFVERHVRHAHVPVMIVDGGTQDAHDMLAASDFAVVTSGTATLETMCLGTPMVVVYRLSRSTYAIARRMAAVPYAALPSLVAGHRVVPELLQDALTPSGLAGVIIDYLGDAQRRARQRDELLRLRERLGPPGAARRAAVEILAMAAMPAPLAPSMSLAYDTEAHEAAGRRRR